MYRLGRGAVVDPFSRVSQNAANLPRGATHEKFSPDNHVKADMVFAGKERTMSNKPNRFAICAAKDDVIYDKTREVLDFLILADAIPQNFLDLGHVFQSRDAAVRALALYWVIRIRNEQKLDLASDIVKSAYHEIINGERYCGEVDNTCYFVRPVAFDDPTYGAIGYYSPFGRYEKFIPTLDAYLIFKK